MQVVTGAMGSLIPKLIELLKDEYNLQKGVKKDVEFLVKELPSMHAALRKVADVPRDQLDKQVKLWADEVRELSYLMEDVVDSFMIGVEGSEPASNSHNLMVLLKKMGNLIPKGKVRRKIANKIKGIKVLVKEVADRRDRYRVDDAVANLATTQTVDPRILALFKDHKELVGIDLARKEITEKLTDGDVSNRQLKILSICGIGGLGKTTLAKVVHSRLQEKFMLKAFISVGQRPDVKKVLRDIFLGLDKEGYMISNGSTLDEKQLIEELQKILENKRYFIVIDDIWNVEAWKIIRCALKDNNCASRIITTTHSLDVAKKSGEVYQLKPLSQDHSEELFYTRLYGCKSKCPFDQPVDISKKILRKCGGVPLAILTIASLLDGKTGEDWPKVYDSIGFGHEGNQDVDNTRKILLFSYHDLPHYLRTCLLYLSTYPEDYIIWKHTLIWKWVAEGFIKEELGIRQYELGERYFNELVNRSMIQPIESDEDVSFIIGCRVHDLVLDMICWLSKEHNFVKVLDINDEKVSWQSNNAHRLAVQKRVIVEGHSLANLCMPHMRSFNMTACNIHVMPSLSSFRALLVLAMEACNFIKNDNYHLKHLGNLVQLRYLGLQRTPLHKLAEEIGKLKFLQTLDLQGTWLIELPQSIGQLGNLKCLNVDSSRIGRLHLLGNLTTLEDLTLVYTNGSSQFLSELGKLTELRKLNMSIYYETRFDNSMVKALVESLGKLQKIQALHLFADCVSVSSEEWKGYVPSRQLRELSLIMENKMLPPWIDPSLLPRLTYLQVKVEEVKARDMKILGSFPALLTLTLKAWQDFLPDVPVGAGGGLLFPKLMYFSTPAPVRFLTGAMPSLRELVFSYLLVGRLKWKDSRFVFEFGSLGNLLSLQRVGAGINRNDASQEYVDQAVDALGVATNEHPNRPSLQIRYHEFPKSFVAERCRKAGKTIMSANRCWNPQSRAYLVMHGNHPQVMFR